MNVKVLMNKNSGQLGVGFEAIPSTISDETERLGTIMDDSEFKVIMISKTSIYWLIQSAEDQPFVFIFDQSVVGERIEVIGEL